MTQDLRVALTTSLNDRLVAPLRRAVDEVEKNLKDVEKQLDRVNTAGKKVGQTVPKELDKVNQSAAKVGKTLPAIQGPAQAAKQVMDLSRNTENAVRLAERLRSTWSSTGQLLRGVTTGVAAFQAAKYVVGAPMQQERSYERQLADAANTAFTDRDLAGKRAGMGELGAAVTGSLRSGGGKREDVLAALNEMLASGTVTAGQAQVALPTIAKYATAGNASPQELSMIVVRALQSGFKEADIPRILDMALAAGQKGGFELKDMARWLPKLLAAGTVSGLNGMEGYARILASAQGSLTTAGSKDEAGNNLLNLLLKINSNDTAVDAKKLGIDLAGSLAAARGKGVNSLDAFVNLVEQVAGRDSRMVDLRRQAAGAGTDQERKATLNAQADILQGSAIGKIVQDRQALLALVAELNKRDYIKDVQGAVMGANGQYGASNFGLIASTSDFRINQQSNEKLFAQEGPMGSANAALAQLAEWTTNVYQQYPALAAALEATKIAVYGLAAAAGAAGLAQLATGGGLAGAAGAAGRVAGSLGGMALAAAPVVAAGALGATIGTRAYTMGLEGTSAGDALGGGIAKLLALLGSDDAKAAVASREKYESQAAAERASLKAQADALTALAQRPIQVVIDGREVATSVNDRNAWLAKRS